MNCAYENLSVYSLGGEYTSVDQRHVLHDEQRLTVLLSKGLGDILDPFARQMAAREALLSGKTPTIRNLSG